MLLATESETKRHPEYPDAKAGDAVAAANLVDALVGEAEMAQVRDLIVRVSDSGAPTLVSANAYERGGLNAIPAALAKLLSGCTS